MDFIGQRHLRLLTFTAILAGGTLCPLAIPALAGVGTMLAGVAGGIVANDVIAYHLTQLSAKLRQSGDTLANQDITKATGLTVGLVIQSVAESGRYPQAAKELKHLATTAAQQWTMFAQVNRDGEFGELDPLQEEQINNLFAKSGREFYEQTVLTVDDWCSVLRDGLCVRAKITLPDEIVLDLAQTLHHGFAKALREVFKSDFEEGGKAFSGLTLSMLGEILAILREAPERSPAIRDGLTAIETLQQQLRRENAAGFVQLGHQIDSGFETLLEQFGITQAQLTQLHGWLQQQLDQIARKLDVLQDTANEIKSNTEEIIDSIQEFIESQQRRKVQGMSFSLDTSPPTVTHWQGRERDLAVVEGWLNDENTKLGVIVGIAGMGKSTLAAKVFRQRTDFVGKLWLDLGQRPAFSIVARGILSDLVKLSPEDLQQIEEIHLTTVLIRCLQEQRFLLVLDNLESVLEDEGYRDFLQQWLGKCYRTEILVTTQVVPPLVQNLPTELALQGLSPREGAQLLQALKIGGTAEVLAQFVERVNGHPLTLQLVVGLLNDEKGEGATIEDLAALGMAEVGELMGRLEGMHRQELVPLVAVLATSFNRLTATLRKVLLSLVVLRQGFDAQIATAVSGETVTDKLLRELVKRGFLVAEGPEFYTFQPFIAEYLKFNLGDLTARHEQAIAFYQKGLKSREEWQTVADVREYLEIFYHLCELGEYERAFDRIRQGDNVYEFLTLRGNYEVLVDLYRQLVEHLPNHQDWRYPASLTSLGNAYNSLGQYREAIAFHEQSLEIQRAIGNRGGEATSLNNLGNAYYSLGQYREAIAFHEQSLEIERAIGNRGGEANSLGNLGNAYNSLGQYREAIAFHEQSLEIERAIGNRGGEANSLGNLGNAYNSLGQYREAIAFHEQSLEIQRAIGNRGGEANSLIGLGNAYYSLGQYREAIAFHEQSLEIQRAIGDRRGEATSLGNLGSAYDSLGQYREAIAFHEQSLEIKRAIGDRRGEANSLQNLGALYPKIGRIKEGFAASQQAQLIYQELDLPLEAYPIPNWMKTIAKFARRSKVHLIGCAILGVFAFPFAIVGLVGIILYRLIRSRFARR
ncbi:tetratricopeptide repeat protein [Oxynema aestuarii AP17]|uniref:Tetratricopeptide repeat protein n=1 Tax=Oxynema aestuarii AP17 TaxID=2064643 RepID=A0A6H1U5M9_9CYAN|nr:tetratricopeptide repeat protein [Oxynema aestuarii AP17]